VTANSDVSAAVSCCSAGFVIWSADVIVFAVTVLLIAARAVNVLGS
jgi:hypothetical protein